MESREQAALRQIEKSLENVNLEVSSDIQSIFDRFSSIYPTKWAKNNSIEILEEYIIEPPYDTVKVLHGKEGKALARLASMVSHIISSISVSLLTLPPHFVTLTFSLVNL